MTEGDIWNKLSAMLSDAGGDATRHEERGRRGIPDVSYGLNQINGWVELKAYDKWPRQGVVKFDNFQSYQKLWLVRRHDAGGSCFVIAAFGLEMLMFSGQKIRLLGTLDERQMRQIAICSWKAKFDGNLTRYLGRCKAPWEDNQSIR